MGSLSDVLTQFAQALRAAIPDDGGSLAFTLPPGPLNFARLRSLSETIEQPKTRICCAIGWDESTWYGELGQASTNAMGVHDLLHGHRYFDSRHLGDIVSFHPVDNLLSIDPVGHIYSLRGGIVDIGHLRDHADLARYLAYQARISLMTGRSLPLGNEGGQRTVRFLPQATPPTPEVCALVGAAASYDVAIWHEIFTYYGTTFLTSQNYSSFSPEDNFSNLLGALVGFRAVLTTDHDYNEAVDLALRDVLTELGTAPLKQTKAAIDYVRGVWYRYTSLLGTGLGENLELLRRHMDAIPSVTPWLITDLDIPSRAAVRDDLWNTLGHPSPVTLRVPTSGPQGEPLSQYYQVEIAVDEDHVPVTELGLARTDITAAGFPTIIAALRQRVLAAIPNGDQPA